MTQVPRTYEVLLKESHDHFIKLDSIYLWPRYAQHTRLDESETAHGTKPILDK